jgi:surfeit locus 1 family protein
MSLRQGFAVPPSQAAGPDGGKSAFPVGLTVAALVVFAICVTLGVWQLQRAAWKEAQLARINALQNAPPVPIAPVLLAASKGANVALTRVAVACASGKDLAVYPVWPSAFFNGQPDAWVTHAIAYCRLTNGPYDGIDVDRGGVTSSVGKTEAPKMTLPPPQNVVGVLGRIRKLPIDTGHSAPYVLSVEREQPSPPGVAPGMLVQAKPANLQYVGAYAPTWFGLAGVAMCFYAAMLWRRLRSP